MNQQINIYSTLSRKTEAFTPIKPGEVGMYACGITVYDESHIGHGRQAIVFDVIRRYLEFAGLKVTYVRNFTDVDDKIINKANKLGKPAHEVSEFYIESTREDLKNLKVRPATFEPKVTEHIPDIIKFIEELIVKGYAYVGGGDVLFDVQSMPSYGKLSGRSLDDCLNADESSIKRNPQDFALWKGAKPGEPFWESPWGRGRPGWHIECSVMAGAYLGAHFDIHGGGVDLVFPHHENEIAQSEARSGEPYANYWIHNGLINVNGQKMSKSLGNMYSIKDALRDHHPEVIRFAVLSSRYNAPMDFSDTLFRTAIKRVYYFYKALLGMDEIIAAAPGAVEEQEGVNLASSIRNDFVTAMNDDFNTAKALADVAVHFAKINEVLAAPGGAKKKAGLLAPARKAIAEIAGVIGLFDEDPKDCLERLRGAVLAETGVPVADIDDAIRRRKEAKANKDYKSADAIRAELQGRGIALQDKPGGETVWDVII